MALDEQVIGVRPYVDWSRPATSISSHGAAAASPLGPTGARLGRSHRAAARRRFASVVEMHGAAVLVPVRSVEPKGGVRLLCYVARVGMQMQVACAAAFVRWERVGTHMACRSLITHERDADGSLFWARNMSPAPDHRPTLIHARDPGDGLIIC
jgi:hypothetical protein